MYPEKFNHLIELLEQLPGVGKKTATRYAFFLLNKNASFKSELIDSINGLNTIKKCKVCGFLSDEDECLICKDKSRNGTDGFESEGAGGFESEGAGGFESEGAGGFKSNETGGRIITVVAYPSDVVALESLGEYKGRYHVLNGLISSSKGIFPEDINIESLFKRLDGINEIILALPSTVEGEITSLYIEKLLKDYDVTVSKLASGIPMGTSLEYADDLTLSKALNNRIKVGK